jgi:hypothetical protein
MMASVNRLSWTLIYQRSLICAGTKIPLGLSILEVDGFPVGAWLGNQTNEAGRQKKLTSTGFEPY